MKKFQSVLVLCLAAVMLLALSACRTTPTPAPVQTSAAAQSAVAESTAPEATATVAPTLAPATLQIIFVGDNTPPAENNVLKAIKEKTGVTVDAIYVPGADFTTKLNTLVAAKTLPDVMPIGDLATAMNLKNNGALAELTALLPQYMPAYYADAGDALAKHALNTDGKIYSTVKMGLGYNANLSIRTDWLKNVDLEMPTDLDALYAVLDAFTNKDPNQNGKKDTFGLEAAMNLGFFNFSTIFGAFGVPAGKPVQLDDGTVTTFMKSPGFLDAVKYINKLYQNGLMDPDFVTVPTMDAFGKLWNGQAGAFDFQCVGTTNNWMPSRYTETPTPTFDFATIKGPDGKYGLPMLYPNYTSSTVVASTCKSPEAALSLLEFLYSEEGDTLTRLGVEDLHFKWTDKAAGKYEMIKPYDDSATNRNDGVFVYWATLISPMDNIEKRTFNAQTRDGVALAEENSIIAWPYITSNFEASTTYGATLTQIEKEVFSSLVISTGDLDAEYQAGVARWESEGGTQWEQEATATYKAQQ